MAKQMVAVRLDPELLARLDAAANGSRSAFIVSAIEQALGVAHVGPRALKSPKPKKAKKAPPVPPATAPQPARASTSQPSERPLRNETVPPHVHMYGLVLGRQRCTECGQWKHP